MMNFIGFFFEVLSFLSWSESREENKADTDPINKKLSFISLGLILISVLLIYFFRTEIFIIENLFKTILWSFSGSILISLISLIILNHFRIIHSLVM